MYSILYKYAYTSKPKILAVIKFLCISSNIFNINFRLIYVIYIYHKEKYSVYLRNDLYHLFEIVKIYNIF